MKRWILALAGITAALAGFTSPPSVKQASAAPQQPAIEQDVRGIAMGANYFTGPADADQTVELMQELGFNSLRLIVKWDDDSPLEQWQVDGVCNAARSMVEHNMSTIILNLLPKNSGWPNTDDTRARFIGSQKNLLDLLLNRTDGCATRAMPDESRVPALKVEVMPVNEPNIITFCDAATDDDNMRHQICADWAVRLDHAVYVDIQAEEASLGVNIPVIAMALGSHHNPIGFLNDYCKSRASLGYAGEVPDFIGLHPYSLQGSDDPFSGIRTTPDFKAAVKACFGSGVGLIYTESGFETKVSPDQGYTCSTPPSVLQVDPADWGAVEARLYRLGTKYGVQGIYNFQLYDEQCLNPGWQSGMLTWNGVKKPLWDAMKRLLEAAGNPIDG